MIKNYHIVIIKPWQWMILAKYDDTYITLSILKTLICISTWPIQQQYSKQWKL